MSVPDSVVQRLTVTSVGGETFAQRIQRLVKMHRIDHEYDLRWYTNQEIYQVLQDPDINCDWTRWRVKNEVHFQLPPGHSLSSLNGKPRASVKADVVLHYANQLKVVIELKVFRGDVEFRHIEQDLIKLNFYLKKRVPTERAVFIYLRPETCADKYTERGKATPVQYRAQQALLNTSHLTILPIGVDMRSMQELSQLWEFQKA